MRGALADKAWKRLGGFAKRKKWRRTLGHLGQVVKDRPSPLVASVVTAIAACMYPIALGQNIFDDNELRSDLIMLADTVVKAEERARLLGEQIQRLEAETSQLRRLIKELGMTLETSQKSMGEREVRIEAMQASAANTLEKSEGEARRGTALLRSILEGIDGREYSEALRSYNQLGDVAGSLKRLRGIVAYGSLSPYAGSARYWIGKINHQQGANGTAKKELRSFIENHPGDHRVPDAMLMLADIAKVENDPDAARMENEILRLHPTSDAADKVRAMQQ